MRFDPGQRKRIQFSLSWLLAAIVIVSILLAIAVPIVRTLDANHKNSEAMLYYDKLGHFYLDVSGGGLDLHGRNIKNEDLKLLPALRRIRCLELHDNPIDDDAVDYIQQCTWLVYVNVRDTEISLDGAKRLRRALPKCEMDTAFDYDYVDSEP